MFTVNWGSLYRVLPAYPSMSPHGHSVDANLPEWVERINVSISRGQESTFLVTADVVTSSKMDDLIVAQLRVLQPPPVELYNLKNLARLGSSYSEYSAATAYATAFQQFLDNFRRTIEDHIFHRHFSFGYFTSHNRRLPAIDIVEIGNTTTGDGSWIDSSLLLRYRLGFVFDTDYYRGDNIAMGIPAELPVRGRALWRLVLSDEFSARHTNGEVPIAGREKAMFLQGELVDTLQLLSRNAHQGVVTDLLSTFRRRTYFSKPGLFGFIKQVALYEEISRESLLIERCRAYFAKRSLVVSDLSFLNEIHYHTLFVPDEVVSEPASIELKEAVLETYQDLTKSFSEVSSYFAGVLAARNYRVMFGLTVTAIAVAAIAIVITLATEQRASPNPYRDIRQPTVLHNTDASKANVHHRADNTVGTRHRFAHNAQLRSH
ncbi:MAG: hypothetical protein IAI50_16120 [Candidatus Eremiobacteraeota bacterium]|nr:hypothetical protein [Candidatus Eremiobacteraeota bacterium]